MRWPWSQTGLSWFLSSYMFANQDSWWAKPCSCSAAQKLNVKQRNRIWAESTRPQAFFPPCLAPGRWQRILFFRWDAGWRLCGWGLCGWGLVPVYPAMARLGSAEFGGRVKALGSCSSGYSWAVFAVWWGALSCWGRPLLSWHMVAMGGCGVCLICNNI